MSSLSSSMQCPRLQPQQLCLPRKRSQSIGMCMQGPNGTAVQCELDPSAVKANFVESLVDTAAIVIESIWPPLPGSSECPQKQKGLPLRTFIQETLKRSRSSYSTLQTALFYLHKIRNKVPSAYLKRRQDQLYQNYHILSTTQPAAGLMTPPASPRHHQNAPDLSNLQGPDYFSLRATPDSKCVLPSPLSSTCSLPSSSPASSTGYSPCSSTSPSSTTSSPTSSSSSPSCSVSTTCATSSPTSTQASSSTQSNRIIYCGRRTFLAALMVASKYLQDRNYSNKAWAKISGLSIKEINANELIFLKLIDYSLFVSHDTFMRWTAILVARGQEATRKFMQSADAAHVGTFTARTLSAPSLVLNGSHIRYAPMKSMPNIPVSPPNETDEESTVACSVPKRHAKVARSSTYPPLQSSYLHTSSEAFAF
ncbi:hypothetical protein BGZ51_006701 [Haplosporangium sp. Z 767]|nr:hypothetical protein BGZ51_006701 [Haplosporangium sp. Z 767]KAF9194502.1 hypothetical protein BGZ50_006227 [Haplosporangium sp. Z 11]